MFYFSEGILCEVLTGITVSANVEMMAIEFCQMIRKWLLLGAYKPPIQSDSEFTEEIIGTLNHFIPSYEKILFLGDLSMTAEIYFLIILCKFLI